MKKLTQVDTNCIKLSLKDLDKAIQRLEIHLDLHNKT